MPVMPGAEPFFHSGGNTGVLLCHGFTGTPASLRPWADTLAAAGLTVSLPRLPGHGTTWQDIDGSALAIPSFTPAATGSALISANADLWTQNAGVNQDIGIFVSGGAFGTGQIVGWKESGGNAGTFSPNAAFAQTVVQFAAATSYTIKLQWKTNHATTGTIRAAAGLGPAPNFSPTRLTLRVFPAGNGIQDAATNSQYAKANSTGSDWTPIDATNLQLTFAPLADSLFILSGNADLWTANAGVNQDIGIFISGGAYGTGKLVAWKESGGFAGTFSPNAAFVQSVMPLAGGTTYTITLEWGSWEGDVFAIDRHPSHRTAYTNVFLHPIVRRYRRRELVAEHHVLEDLLGMYCAGGETGFVRRRSERDLRRYHLEEHEFPMRAFFRRQLSTSVRAAGGARP